MEHGVGMMTGPRLYIYMIHPFDIDSGMHPLTLKYNVFPPNARWILHGIDGKLVGGVVDITGSMANCYHLSRLLAFRQTWPQCLVNSELLQGPLYVHPDYIQNGWKPSWMRLDRSFNNWDGRWSNLTCSISKVTFSHGLLGLFGWKLAHGIKYTLIQLELWGHNKTWIY